MGVREFARRVSGVLGRCEYRTSCYVFILRDRETEMALSRQNHAAAIREQSSARAYNTEWHPPGDNDGPSSRLTAEHFALVLPQLAN